MASTTGHWSGGRSHLRWLETLKCRVASVKGRGKCSVTFQRSLKQMSGRIDWLLSQPAE